MFEKLWKTQLKSTARVVLNSFGGYLVAKGILTAPKAADWVEVTADIAVDLSPIVAAWVWTLIENWQAKQKQIAAVEVIRASSLNAGS